MWIFFFQQFQILRNCCYLCVRNLRKRWHIARCFGMAAPVLRGDCLTFRRFLCIRKRTRLLIPTACFTADKVLSLPPEEELRLSEGATGVEGEAIGINPSELSVPFLFFIHSLECQRLTIVALLFQIIYIAVLKLFLVNYNFISATMVSLHLLNP